VLQLKVKTGFVVTDDIDATVERIIWKIISENQDRIEQIKGTFNPGGNKTVNKLYNDRFKEYSQEEILDTS
jgi:hypothetical protein